MTGKSEKLTFSDIEEYLKNMASIVYMVDGTNYNAYDIAVYVVDSLLGREVRM